MSDLLTPKDVERLARQAGITVKEVCVRAGIAPSIFSRWKAGKTEPSLDNYRRIRDVAEAAVAPKQRQRRSDASPRQPVKAA